MFIVYADGDSGVHQLCGISLMWATPLAIGCLLNGQRQLKFSSLGLFMGGMV